MKTAETLIYTNELVKERKIIEQKVLNNFLYNFPQYADMTETYYDIVTDFNEFR